MESIDDEDDEEQVNLSVSELKTLLILYHYVLKFFQFQPQIQLFFFDISLS